jgi:hypothetical protein
MWLKDRFQVQTVVGQPMTVGEITVTPQSQAIIVRLPRAGFVWHRPTAIVVEQDGQKQHFPIRDVTRSFQLCLLGIGLALLLGRLIKLSRRKEFGS